VNRTIKDTLFGMIGGLAGTVVIGQVMGALSKFDSEKNRKQQQRLVSEPPTEKLARRISRDAFGYELSDDEKAAMGQAISWGYGIFWGGVYGLLRRHLPASRTAAGMPFGLSLGLLGNAVLLPATGLTPPPTEFPISAHARNLASHCAYAATVEGVCQLCETLDGKIRGEKPRTKPELRQVS
jgi:uncharacterized membrane protein YagU involved in acid resistance